MSTNSKVGVPDAIAIVIVGIIVMTVALVLNEPTSTKTDQVSGCATKVLTNYFKPLEVPAELPYARSDYKQIMNKVSLACGPNAWSKDRD